MIIEKLQSRKFWVAVVTGCIVVFGKALGLNLDDAQVWAIAITAAGYIGGQGAVDAVRGLRS